MQTWNDRRANGASPPVLQVLGLKLPNMLGRAEKLTFQFSYGTKETSYGLSFFKPQPGHFERKYVVTCHVILSIKYKSGT